MASPAGSVSSLSNKLAELTQNASAPSSMGDARVKLHLVQALERALHQASQKELKEGSHDAMTALVQLLERGCCGAVRRLRGVTLRGLASTRCGGAGCRMRNEERGMVLCL